MKKTYSILYWTPRILSILFICFLSLFSLDVFEPGKSAEEVAVELLLHNIPSIVMILVLILAWKREIIGAVCFFGAGTVYMGLVIYSMIQEGLPWYLGLPWSMIIAGPAFLTGGLFLACWRRKMGNST